MVSRAAQDAGKAVHEAAMKTAESTRGLDMTWLGWTGADSARSGQRACVAAANRRRTLRSRPLRRRGSLPHHDADRVPLHGDRRPGGRRGGGSAQAARAIIRHRAADRSGHSYFLTPPRGGGRVFRMGSILIRQVPDLVHKDFKRLCQAKNTSMEKEMIRRIAREVRLAAQRREKAPRSASVPVPTA